jgi:actin-related protein 10
MFPQIQTTPIAGSRLTSHIRALLLMFATYLPPPTSLSAAISVPAANRAMRVPQEVLTDLVVEEIKTRCCFVGDVLGSGKDTRREDTPSVEENLDSDMDLPPSSDASASESDFSQSVSYPDSGSGLGTSSQSHEDHTPGAENHLQAIASMYKRYSTAADIQMRVTPPPSQQTGTGQGTLVIPGWIRERSAEVLFEGGDVDESSVAELILDALLKVSASPSRLFRDNYGFLGS